MAESKYGETIITAHVCMARAVHSSRLTMHLADSISVGLDARGKAGTNSYPGSPDSGSDEAWSGVSGYVLGK